MTLRNNVQRPTSATRYLALVFVLTTNHISRTTSYGIGKCCGVGEVLTLISGNLTCVLASIDGPELHELDPSVAGLPHCETLEDLTATPVVEFSDNVFGSACLELLYETTFSGNTSSPVIVHCRSADDRERKVAVPKMLNVRRCCPLGEVFSIFSRACVPTDREVPTISFLAGLGAAEFVTVLRGPPKCEHAIVDYEVNSSNLFLDNGRLQVEVRTKNDDVVDLSATEENACLDIGSSREFLAVRACRNSEFCRKNSCVRKCCSEDGAMLVNKCEMLPPYLTTMKLHEKLWNVPKRTANLSKSILNSTDYGLLIGKPCTNGMYAALLEEKWHITPEGYIHIPGYKTFQHDQYCMEMYYNHSTFEDDLYPFICFDEASTTETSPIRYEVNATLQLTSCMFLLITLLVYICLPALQNLHGKTLMCHVGSLFLAYACLGMVIIATLKSTPNEPNTKTKTIISCNVLGYMILFSFQSAFSWLNVMCFDIWWTFGGLHRAGSNGVHGRGHRKRFLLYCLYAFGLAFTTTALSVFADMTDYFPPFLQPKIGVERCWFAQGPNLYGEILFFMGPTSVQLLVNVIFFILTARSCSRVKSEIRRVIASPSDLRSRRFQADKTKLIMNLKLFIVMGISWVLEIISYFLNHYTTSPWKEEAFYVFDVFNCLQGVLIFILFVLKKKVYYALRKRLGLNDKRQASSAGIHDPYRIRKNGSGSTLTSSTVAINSP